ncbi:unnamed protein product [Adineta steineri]|uniref:EGF-like domain-containing protein n=1 Tax=Adineta steineri TaxID=433720 RepID=A0A819JT36_9BILA|nr:unnamed protein product [Adineta steineri]CAF3935518.1 unnamed protein product [Adineta steineri]
MPSSAFSSSDVTFFSRLPQSNLITERSRSKRLYTFIHYEHSTHPRRFIIAFFVIIALSLSIAWLIAGLVRLRQTASYLESCAEGKAQCISQANLICSSTLFICLCPEQTFWDTNFRKCLTVRNINATCSINQQCDTSKGLICQQNSICQCPSNTYYSGTNCTTFLLFGDSCLTTSTPLCNTELGLICDPGTQICICPVSTYWSNARCESVSTYSSYCDRNTSCNTQVGLFCRLPGSYPACDCPLQSKLYTCDCNQGQAWVVGTGMNSTSSCMNQGTSYNNCTSNSQCSQTLNLVCISGICDCNVPLWFWSQTSNKCLPCESEGYILIQYSSQWVCTQLISSSLMTYTASQSTCTAIGWSLISPIFASDIVVIAQTYSTYRLWVNIQTSIGSSSYTNNIFPYNQSNWTAYVSKSLTAVYSTYIYALQIIPTYDPTKLFEGNTNFDTGQTLCALY